MSANTKLSKKLKTELMRRRFKKEINKMKILKNISFTILKIIFVISVLMTFGNVTIFDFL